MRRIGCQTNCKFDDPVDDDSADGIETGQEESSSSAAEARSS